MNSATFDATRCTDEVAQAQFCAGLAKILGISTDLVKITNAQNW